jgi:hypothetical protein
LLEEAPLHSFYSVAKSEENCIVCYHMIPGSEDLSSEIYQAISSSSTLSEAFDQLYKINHLQKEVTKMKDMLL